MKVPTYEQAREAVKNKTATKLEHLVWFLNSRDDQFTRDLQAALDEVVEGKPNLKQSVEILCEALRNDSGLWIAYKANIAMAFKDEFDRFRKTKSRVSSKDIHQIANTAATNFLESLCRPIEP